MINFLIKKVIRANRGQINIAEVAVSATIILVISVSIAQVTSGIYSTNQEDNIDIFKDRLQKILDLTSSSGILRELVYSTDPDSSSAQIEILSIIDSYLPPSTTYSLYQNSADDSDHVWNNRILLGLSPPPSGSLKIVSVSTLISGYSNDIEIQSVPFVVTFLAVVGV